jgi:hypothetical protein
MDIRILLNKNEHLKELRLLAFENKFVTKLIS